MQYSKGNSLKFDERILIKTTKQMLHCGCRGGRSRSAVLQAHPSAEARKYLSAFQSFPKKRSVNGIGIFQHRAPLGMIARMICAHQYANSIDRFLSGQASPLRKVDVQTQTIMRSLNEWIGLEGVRQGHPILWRVRKLDLNKIWCDRTPWLFVLSWLYEPNGASLLPEDSFYARLDRLSQQLIR
jgi:hypothetical protein